MVNFGQVKPVWTTNRLLVDTPLSVCAINGDLNGVRLWLVTGMDAPEEIVRTDSTYENSALHWACYYGHEKIVEELLEAKADVNQKNKVV